jgi:carboxymethylenebutenolidase
VVIHPAGGVAEFTQGIAGKLAEQGYAAVCPDLFHRITDPNLTDGVAKAGSLKDPEVIDDVNATVDFMLAHSAIDSQRIGITGFCMGGRITWLAAAVNPHFKAAAPYYGGNLMGIRGGAEKSPFELASGINCPILFHFGEIDANPSQDDMRKLDDELTRLGKPHQFYTYPNADHAFADHTGPRYHRESAEVSWPRTLDFFAAHLGGKPVTG